ncbi:MAG: ABC transporter permease [bacterium]|nr:ABC transporter permease [bacterium]
MNDFMQDLRLSFRQMLRNPGFTMAAVLCLALGIGGITATFTFAHSLLRQQPHVTEPDRLVRLFISWSSGLEFGSFSYPDYRDLRDRSEVWTGFAAESITPFQISSEGRNERLWGSIVSGNYFTVLGVAIPRGRGFLPEEDRTPGSHPVVVLSHGLWERRFAGDPEILGREMVLNGRPFTIVGVGPEGFYGPNVGIRSELWVPMMMQEAVMPGRAMLEVRGSHWITFTIGRLKPGTSVAQAREESNAVMAQLIETYPDSNTGKTVVLYPEAKASLHPMVRGGFVGFLGLMFAVVGLVLLLACANVAGLLLARAAGRSREIAIRLALGSGRGRLIRQLLTESIALALVAGAAGLLLGIWLIRMLRAFQPGVDIPLEITAELDLWVLGVTFGVSLVTGVLFGLAPTLRTTRPELVPALKEGGAVPGSRSSRLRKALVVGQVTMSLILLIAAGMVLRSLDNARHIDVGFEPAQQVIASVDLNLQGYSEADGREFFRALRERVAALPGVVEVGFAEVIPLSMHNQQNSAVPSGYEVPDDSETPLFDYNLVGPGYFAAMGIPILRGRGFETADAEGRPVTIVNEAMARRYWPGRSPIGERLETFGDDHEVVGVVRTGRYGTLGEDPRPYFYVPIDRYYRGVGTLHVRTGGDPTGMLEAVRREVHALDETLPVYNLKPMDEHLGFMLLAPRMLAVAVTAFASLALLLAAIGLYAIIAYWVSQGVRDIGIRMALGAGQGNVIRLVVRQGVWLTLLGVFFGLLLGLFLSWVIARLLYGVTFTEAPVYLIACAVLVAVAFVASYLPARRATRIDPMTVLRAE